MPKKSTEKQTNIPESVYRLNLSLDPESKDELEILKTVAKKSSLVDVIRSALVVYKSVVELQKSGGKVVFRYSETDEEVIRFI